MRKLLAIVLTLLALPVAAQDQAPRRVPTYAQQQEKINAWTLGLAAGLIEGAPLRLASELSRVVDDGDNLHVLPIVTRGPTENVNSLLYLKGVDLAIINSDSLDEYKAIVPDIQKHITYLFSFFPSELQILVRPEINSLDDLKGKKVNFNTLGTAAAYSGPLIFSRLGLDVQKTFIPHPQALQQLQKGENDMAAVVFITSKPVDAFLKGRWDGFHLLGVPFDEGKFGDYYLPTELTPIDYPGLIPAGSKVDTISVPTILVAYNWPAGSDRYKRVARFVDYLFKRDDKLKVAGYSPQWKSLDLNATVPGLERFKPVQDLLDQKQGKQVRK